MHYVLFKQEYVAEEKVGEVGWGGSLYLLVSNLSSFFEKSIFKKISACTAHFWQCNFVLFQKLCWIWKTTITVFILSCQKFLGTIKAALHFLCTPTLTCLKGSDLAFSHKRHQETQKGGTQLNPHIAQDKASVIKNLWPDFPR